MNTLLSMLTDDVVMVTDGGGKTRAAINPIYGRDKVARFIFAILQKAVELYPGAELTAAVAEINGQPGIITYADGVPYSTVTLELDNGQIVRIDSVVNPEKLERVKRET